MNTNIRITRKLFNFMLGIYIMLLPIGTGLAGIIGNTSLLNYFAGIIILIGIFNVRYIYKNQYSTVIYYIFTIISVVWATTVKINWYVMTNIVNFILYIVITSRDWNKEEVRFIEKCIALSQFVVFWAVIKNLNTVLSYRLSITIVSSMGVSDFACGLCLLIAYWMNKMETGESASVKFLASIFVILDFAIIVMTGSRGAIVMFAAMAVLWIFGKNKSLKFRVCVVFLAIVAYILFTKYFIGLLPKSVINRLSIDAIESNAGSGRFNIWRLAFEKMINSNPFRMLFGYGFNTFTETISYGSFGGHIDMMAHNAVIQTMVEGGIVGVACLLKMFADQIKIAWSHNTKLFQYALIGLITAALSIDMEVTRIWGMILTLNYVYSLSEGNTKEQSCDKLNV